MGQLVLCAGHCQINGISLSGILCIVAYEKDYTLNLYILIFTSDIFWEFLYFGILTNVYWMTNPHTLLSQADEYNEPAA